MAVRGILDKNMTTVSWYYLPTGSTEDTSSGSIIYKAGSKCVVLVNGSLNFFTKDPDDTTGLLINSVVVSFPAQTVPG